MQLASQVYDVIMQAHRFVSTQYTSFVWCFCMLCMWLESSDFLLWPCNKFPDLSRSLRTLRVMSLHDFTGVQLRILCSWYTNIFSKLTKNFPSMSPALLSLWYVHFPSIFGNYLTSPSLSYAKFSPTLCLCPFWLAWGHCFPTTWCNWFSAACNKN